MTVLTLVQAVNQALSQEMDADPAVLVLGEDVGADGGVFRATDGLLKRFGPNRVIDTPLSELGIAGVSICLAVAGLKPVAEVQFDGFTYSTFDQLISHAGRIRNRSRGLYHVPLVLRAPYGGGIHAPEHHSESPETYFAHTPGLKVAIPSNPYDAKGLLISAIRDPDPVIFFEPKRIYRAVKQDVPDEPYTIPIGKAAVVQPGSDVTVITWGAMVRVCQQAAALTKASMEIIDLRTISPYDQEAVLASVKKTGRAVIVHEAPRTCGFGAEIAALIAEQALLSLQSPVLRVTGYDIPMPLARLEHLYLPDASRVARAVNQAMGS